jgi:hypothetical protein
LCHLLFVTRRSPCLRRLVSILGKIDSSHAFQHWKMIGCEMIRLLGRDCYLWYGWQGYNWLQIVKIDRQTEKQQNRQTNWQTNRLTNRQTDRYVDRQTDRQTSLVIFVIYCIKNPAVLCSVDKYRKQ